MADRAQYVKHIELYVDSSSSPQQQAASIDALALLLKNGALSLEALVKEMDLYLTTTDDFIRARGVLLLGELIAQLKLVRLTDAVVHTLTTFFLEKLEDWRALRGALVGCLALLRRKIGCVVNDDDAKALAKSYLRAVQVQSLAQHDRKLSFELLDCLLDRYPNAVSALDDDLLYAICESMDGEKDPQCLILAFHIVQVAAQLYPDPSGPFANYAPELFELMGSYFPIHFTHPTGEGCDVSKDDLSRALMLAFGSSPYFEPYVLPLLIDKLSSSLPSAKADSLKYLVHCTSKYGSDRMAKHAKELWSSLKEILYTSSQSELSIKSESFDGLVFEESDVMNQALILMQELMRKDGNFFTNLILGDEDIFLFAKSLTQYREFDGMPLQIKHTLYAVGRILSVSARSSSASCNSVFEKFFPSLLEALGLSAGNNTKEGCSTDKANILSSTLSYAALHICTELLDASRQIALDFKKENTSIPEITSGTWCCMHEDLCSSLKEVFFSSFEVVAETDQNAFSYLGAKGLQILATFPGSFSPLSPSIFESILSKLLSAITSDFNKTFPWKLKLKSLLEIGLFIYQNQEPDKVLSFEQIVVEKIVSLVSSDIISMPLTLKLEAAVEIGMTSKINMLRVVQGIDKAILDNFTLAYVDGNLESIGLMIKLLECYSSKVLKWFEDNGGSEDVSYSFAASFWEQIESCSSLNLQNNELRSSTTIALKEAVRCCSCEGQEKVMLKIFMVISGSMDSPSATSISNTEGLELSPRSDRHSFQDDWVISLFASVVIALRPQTHFQNVKMVAEMLIQYLGKGHILSAQALGSLVNKLPSKNSAKDLSNECDVEEIVDMIFSSSTWLLCKSKFIVKSSESATDGDGSNHAPLWTSSIVGLAWIGKGLLMRGHEKVKDLAVAFLGVMVQDISSGDSLQLHDTIGSCKEQDMLPPMRAASDAFDVLMNDSADCLNKKYHAMIRPLYKQRFFNSMMPILSASMMQSGSLTSRSMLSRSFAHIVSGTPQSALIAEAKKIIPLLINCLSMMKEDVQNKDIIHSMLLILSGILINKNGQEAVKENARLIIDQLIELSVYPHTMVIRETAVQCLFAMSRLPHPRIYPLITKVKRALSKCLDDPKRAVRLEAVKGYHAWAPIN